MKSIKKTAILPLMLLLLLPLLLIKTEADAASNSLPFYNGGAVELLAPLLPQGGSSTYGRADETIGINPILGQMRYPTMYDGRIGGSSYAPGLNSSFYDPWVGIINRAQQGQAYYHLVPLPGKNSARNVIEIERVSDSVMRTVYNGNPEFMKRELPVHGITNSKNGYKYGDFYYIVELAYYSGGVADNANASDSFSGVNPTWLRFVRTSWPDIKEFKATSTNVELGNTVNFSFNGYEYVSEGRTAVDASITITKDGAEEFKSDLSFHSSKPTANPDKPHEEHAGRYNQENVGAWVPTECGNYTAELKVEDSVKRFATQKVSVTVGGDNCNPTEPPSAPAGTCSLDVNVNPSGELVSLEIQQIADPNGEITESQESAEFDVKKYGIPSSEFLKVWGQSEKYLTDYRYVNMTGGVGYTINVKKSYHLKWRTRYSYDCSYINDKGDEVDKTCYDYEDHEEVVERALDFNDNYSIGYWQIGHLNVYSFDNAVFGNYALPNGEVIVANQDHATASSKHSVKIEDHVFIKPCDNLDLGTQVVNGGNSKPAVPNQSAEFEKAANLGSRTPDVKNDMVEVEKFVSMDGKLTPGKAGTRRVEGPKPEQVPVAPQIPVEQSSLMIDSKKVNMWETQSSVTSNYKEIDGATIKP
ncbi:MULTISPECIES: DUF5704 domain-containing protein [unclassified Sporosarcina]|uniref:DUF5704 domain-containing protein n=1 Tax=unclassified Sporosarcina TaxID=2647733 RepID=UPI001A9329A3|nr:MULTISPECIES: DUF5704 domain-containing protein [unclassified Sporosarcina]MBO0589275.1 hypothetical protein [Sporosarcina sp. E16_8]MBO0601982.1 hypothetical protein [Sporosarcina sp. E16_3]